MPTTTSEVLDTEPAAGIWPAGNPAALRFAQHIVRLHRGLSYRGLSDAVAGVPLYRLDGFEDGLTTVCVRQGQLPGRYLRGVLGFRLAQFLQMGWMDPDLAYGRAMYHEPVTPQTGPETIHTVTLTGTGRIVGYLALVGGTDPVPLPLDSPGRALFPAEDAHHVDLLTGFAAPGRNTHQVYEVKRFIRDLSLAAGPVRDRVPWHLILCLGRTIVGAGEDIQVLVGDSRENGALRHLRMIGFDPVVVDDTAPSLPRTELMWPSYQQPKLAKPFAAEVPARLGAFMDLIESGLKLPHGPQWRHDALAPLVRLLRESRRAQRDRAAGAGPAAAR
jgi:hypothetical protein